MDRLTERRKGIVGLAGCIAECDHPQADCSCVRVRSAWMRLAAYEDTGLEPEICAEYKQFEDNVVKSGTTLRHMLDLAAAEQEGRLVVLPEPEQEGERHDLI